MAAKDKKKVGCFSILLLIIAIGVTVAQCSGDSGQGTEETTNKTATVLDGYVGGELTPLMTAVDKSGYKATYLADGVDFTDFIDDVATDYLVGSLDEDPDAKTVEVTLKLKSNAEQEDMETSLNAKLEVGYAWSAVEKYGKDVYGDGFELHQYLDAKDASAEDADTWSLKAGCEVDGVDMTCEAKVTGTTDDPEVISFDVY